jgi:hypothetical protein
MPMTIGIHLSISFLRMVPVFQRGDDGGKAQLDCGHLPLSVNVEIAK